MKNITKPIDIIKKSVEIFSKKENLIFFLKLYFPVLPFSIIFAGEGFLPASFRNYNNVWFMAPSTLLQILYSLTGIFVFIAGVLGIKSVISGATLSVNSVFKQAWKKYWPILALSVILSLVYGLGFLLLIVPGVLFSVWFAFAKFVAIENGYGIKKSMMESKKMVKGIFWKILGRLLVFGIFVIIVQFVLGFVPLVGNIAASAIGVLYILPVYLLYKELKAG